MGIKPFWILIIILALQRLSELIIAGRNERDVLREGAVEYDREGYRVIVVMHIAFFVSFIAEYVLLKRNLNTLWPFFLSTIIAAEALRYWAIFSLGKYWNTKILVIPGTVPVSRGPYRYMKHPNYLTVVLEIALLPLIFSCYITAAVFSLLNITLLYRRIRIEERALYGQSEPDGS